MKKKAKIISLSVGIPVLVAALLAGAGIGISQYMAKADQYVKDTKQKNYTEMNQTAQKGQTVFLGDSITEQYPAGEFFESYTGETGFRVYNRGISGEVTSHMRDRLKDNALNLQPRNLVILIGTNDLGAGVKQEEILSNIRSVIETTQKECPQTHIVLQAVYPVNEHMPYLAARIMVGSRKNEEIQALNKQLSALAQEKKVDYLDLTEVLSDENGDLKQDYCYDGLHPNARGYQEITKQILPLLK